HPAHAPRQRMERPDPIFAAPALLVDVAHSLAATRLGADRVKRPLRSLRRADLKITGALRHAHAPGPHPRSTDAGALSWGAAVDSPGLDAGRARGLRLRTRN